MWSTAKLKEVESILLMDVEALGRYYRIDRSIRDEYERVLMRFNRFVLHQEIPRDLQYLMNDSPVADKTADSLRAAAA